MPPLPLEPLSHCFRRRYFFSFPKRYMTTWVPALAFPFFPTARIFFIGSSLSHCRSCSPFFFFHELSSDPFFLIFPFPRPSEVTKIERPLLRAYFSLWPGSPPLFSGGGPFRETAPQSLPPLSSVRHLRCLTLPL